MTTGDELTFKLVVEQAHARDQADGAVIIGRFVEGSIHAGDELELAEPNAGAQELPVPLVCETYSMLCERNWSPPKGVLVAVTVQGIEAGQVKAGSILRAATG